MTVSLGFRAREEIVGNCRSSLVLTLMGIGVDTFSPSTSLCFFFLYVYSFETTVEYFGMKPKSGEKEITPNYVFMVWYEFCSDFKTIWKRESKSISKER